MQSETGFPSSHQLKPYVASKAAFTLRAALRSGAQRCAARQRATPRYAAQRGAASRGAAQRRAAMRSVRRAALRCFAGNLFMQIVCK